MSRSLQSTQLLSYNFAKSRWSRENINIQASRLEAPGGVGCRLATGVLGAHIVSIYSPAFHSASISLSLEIPSIRVFRRVGILLFPKAELGKFLFSFSPALENLVFDLTAEGEASLK
jgi:hypothetical protein